MPGYWLRKLKLFSGFFNTDSIDFDEAVYLQNRLDAMHGHTFNVAGVLRNLAPKCKDLLLECYWAGQPLQCEEELKAVPSPKGFCCVFNYHYERYVQLKKNIPQILIYPNRFAGPRIIIIIAIILVPIWA